MGIFKSRKVVCGKIFCSFFITDNDIKFLEQQNPPEQSWLSILLSKACTLRSPNGLSCAEPRIIVLLASESAGSAWSNFPETSPTAKSLLHSMISKGKSPIGATRIGAWFNFILRVSNASMHLRER
ncbi:hypothetical protein Tco_1490871 [Tanacetum coccineum]